MLCQSGAARAVAPQKGVRRVSVLKSLTAVSLLALGGAAAVGPAQAADVFDGSVMDGSHGQGEFLVPTGVNWSGVYIGGHVGAGWGDVDWSILETPFFNGADPKKDTAFPEGGRISHDIEGWLAGGHLGFNQQFGRVVGGVEVSLSGGDIEEEDFNEHEVKLSSGEDHVVGVRTEIDSLFMATVRIGHAWDRVLAYLKGGYASADVDIEGGEEFFNGGVLEREGAFSSSERHHGFTVGGGFEFALTNRVIFGLEYNYVDLGSETHFGFAKIVDDVGKESTERFAVKVDPDELHVAMARLSFKFGDEAVPVAAAPLK